MVKVNQKDIAAYFSKEIYSTYQEFSRKFNITTVWARKILSNKVVSSLNKNGRYIIYTAEKKFNSNGLIKLNGIIFSRYGNARNTLIQLIKSNDNISSTKIKKIMGLDVSSQITKLLKENKIFCKKKGRVYYYSIKPQKEEIIQEKEFNITSLKEDDKVLRDLQIIKEIKENKKTDVARKHRISVETVNNIEERFSRDGVKGLIHTRKHKTIQISSPKQAAVVVEAVKYPNKDLKEIQESVNESIGLRKIREIVSGIKNINTQKKILLEIN